MAFSPLLTELIDAMRCLPGVGPKTAQRMAFHLLEHRKQGLILSQSIEQSLNSISHCQLCRNYTEQTHCNICQNKKRNNLQLCIVETPADVLALENSQSYRGLYFVLHGHLSPLDGIGPNDIGMDHLQARLKSDNIEEIIIATNPTAEGEATAYYISTLARTINLKITRIAHGVPIGGELEYLDGSTLALAINARQVYED